MEESGYYRTKAKRIAGSQYRSIERKARHSYNVVANQTKRNPYLRSRIFGGAKVFLKPFWEHLNQKGRNDRRRRLRYIDCAYELLRKTTVEPLSKSIPGDSRYVLHRFFGIAHGGQRFIVQVKEDTREGTRTFISVFPEKKE
jgi:hypothetical protein